MTKLQKSKKGFILVELAIVIAVIAILIAVLVPTFISLISKANESADKQLVKNLNTALAVDEASNGKAETMSDALDVAQENGYTLSKISPTSDGYDIVWDQVSNRFVLMEEDEAIYYDSATDTSEMTLWYITNSTSLVSNGKNYYYSNLTLSETSITVTSSVDLSAVAGLTEIVVDAENASSNEVITVVAPSTALVVNNSKSATVNVYGTATTITTTTTYGTASLHIYGEVTGKIEVLKGRVVAESGSYIESIIVTASNIEDVEVVAQSSSTVKALGATNETVAAALASSSKISGVSTSAITTTAVSSVFAGGTGTEASPYLIATAQQLANIGTLSSNMANGNSYYFQLTNDITWNHEQNSYISNYLNGVFDGNDYSITVSADVGDNVAGYGDYWFFKNPINTTIKNLTIYETSFNLAITYGWYSSKSTLTFENVNIGDETCKSTVLMAYKNTSAYIQYYCGQSLTFDSCTNYYSYESDDSGAYMAVFVGGYIRGTNVTFNKCINYGTLKMPYAGIFIGNGSYAKEEVTVSGTLYYNTFNVTDCENYGDIYYYSGGSLVAAINSGSTSSTVTATFNEGCVNNVTPKSLTDSNLKLTYNTETNALTLASTTEYNQYLLTYTRYASYKNNEGTSSGSSAITISFDITNSIDSRWVYGIKLYDLSSYKSTYSKTDDDISSLTCLSDVYYSCSMDGAIVYYDETNNVFVVDYSAVEAENGLIYTLSGAATIKVAAYNASNKLEAVTTATAG